MIWSTSRKLDLTCIVYWIHYLFNDDGRQTGDWICPLSRHVERINTRRTVHNKTGHASNSRQYF